MKLNRLEITDNQMKNLRHKNLYTTQNKNKRIKKITYKQAKIINEL